MARLTGRPCQFQTQEERSWSAPILLLEMRWKRFSVGYLQRHCTLPRLEFMTISLSWADTPCWPPRLWPAYKVRLESGYRCGRYLKLQRPPPSPCALTRNAAEAAFLKLFR